MFDIDQVALDAARQLTAANDVQGRATMQCAIIAALQRALAANPEPEAVRLRDELRERTPSSQWATKGEPDPLGDRYECERAALTMGHLTDDAMANAVFLHGNEQPTIDQLLAGVLPPIAYLTAAKDRIRWLSRALVAAQAALAAAGKQQVGDVHPDDVAVDAFADAMKQKMADARAKGRGGWEYPAQCSAVDLTRLLRDHVEKGDPRDVANFCMMLHQRGESIVAYLDLPYISEDEVQQVGGVQGDGLESVDLEWLAGSIGEVAHRLRTFMPNLAEWSDRARDCGIAAKVLGEIAACQPVGQRPVAKVRQSGGFGPVVTFYPKTFYGTKIPDGADLFLRPTAQALDLAQFRVQVAELLRSEFDLEVADPEDHRHDDGHGEAERLAARIAALIDSQAVGNG